MKSKILSDMDLFQEQEIIVKLAWQVEEHSIKIFRVWEVEQMFSQWKTKMLKWQEFQDKSKTAGNCVDWWSSRFSDDNPDLPYEKYGIFLAIWQLHKDEIERSYRFLKPKSKEAANEIIK